MLTPFTAVPPLPTAHPIDTSTNNRTRHITLPGTHYRHDEKASNGHIETHHHPRWRRQPSSARARPIPGTFIPLRPVTRMSRPVLTREA
jgi:hypothetical protein